MKSVLSSNLKFLRKQDNLTLHDLALLFNISKSAISDYENEKTPLSIHVVLSYCKHFDVSISKIINIKFTSENYRNGHYREKSEVNDQMKEIKTKLLLCKQRVEALSIQNKLQSNILESKDSEISSLKMQIQLLAAMAPK